MIIVLVKKFVPKALMQQNQKNTLVDDLCEVVGSVGYLLFDPTFSSAIANVSSERNFWRNLFFYHSKKMRLKEVWTADKLTVALQESLVQNKLFDIRGYGTKVQYSKVYGTSFTWIDIPNIKIKYKWNLNDFDYTSCVIFKGLSSSVYSKLKAHDFYLSELNQALKKVGNCTMLAPKLNGQGALVYPLLDINNSVRLDFTSYAKMHSDLKRVTSGIPLMKNFSLLKLDHTLITARTGMGKSFLAFALSAELGNCCIQYYLDPKHSDLSSFGRFLGSSRYADNSSDIDTKLDDLVKLMQKRYAIMRKMADKHPRRYVGASADQFGFKPIVIFFDEVSAYLASSKKGIKYLKKLLMLGRQAQIFIVLILQDPRATNNLPSTIKDQTGIRIALGELTGTLAGLVFGSGTILPVGSRNVGEGYIQLDGGEPQLFEAPKMPRTSLALYDLMKEALKNQRFLDPMKHN